MSPKQLARVAMALGTLLLLWGAASLARRGSSGPSAADHFAIPAIASDRADSILINRPADTTRLVRRDSTTWLANGHKASATAVSGLFSALGDTARSTELVATRPASHARLGVDSAKGTTIRIVRGDSTLLELIQGNRGPSLDGGYFRHRGDSAVYMVSGDLAQALDRSSDEWRDRRIGGVARDSVSRIEVQRGRRAYVLRREDKSWKMASGGAVDSTAVTALLTAYADVEAAGFATRAQADSAAFGRPDRKAALLRADGTPLLALAFDSTATGFWVRAAGDSTVYRLDTWNADRLTPADSTLKAAAR